MRHRYLLGGNHNKYSAQQKGRIPSGVVDFLLSARNLGRRSRKLTRNIEQGEGERSPEPLLDVLVKEVYLGRTGNLPVNKVQVGEHDLQLVLPVQVVLPGGKPFWQRPWWTLGPR